MLIKLKHDQFLEATETFYNMRSGNFPPHLIESVFSIWLIFKELKSTVSIPSKKKKRKNIELGRIIKAQVKKTTPPNLNHIHFY